MYDKVKEITCQKLKKKIDKQDSFVLLDVREPEEYEMCHIDGSILVPLSEIEDHVDELDKDKHYVIYCKMGGRSMKACVLFQEKGFKKVQNLSGGIWQWALDVDSRMEMY
tara:strand:- start:439 stop:768 length:330 start_codon:yes stop_codon:yes gene_type:complete